MTTVEKRAFPPGSNKPERHFLRNRIRLDLIPKRIIT